MQTRLSDVFLQSNEGSDADAVLRACVHCGFCNATCPTYLITGNELDGPRGRIYLIKNMLENQLSSKITLNHLDRCLTCQSCESTCPSNVNYHQLLDIGRTVAEQNSRRPLLQRVHRKLLSRTISNKRLMKFMTSVGKFFRPILPANLRIYIPAKTNAYPAIEQCKKDGRKIILLDGCVQGSLTPDTNQATRFVLEYLGIDVSALPGENCCGALSYHLNYQQDGLNQARKNIDLLDKALKNGADYLISTASGCGTFLKDYERLFAHDHEYSVKAKEVVSHIRDVSEIFTEDDLAKLKLSINSPGNKKLAFQCPCSLQHGQKLNQSVETILARLGFDLSPVTEAHICCGSAGTYSITQKEMSLTLRNRKLSNLLKENPDEIATANIGCQLHLQQGSKIKVRHWIENVADALQHHHQSDVIQAD